MSNDHSRDFSILSRFFILYAIFRWSGFLLIGGALGLPDLLFPFLRTPIIKGWNTFARILGFINSRILLSLIFFLILTPLAFLSRLFSKDKLQIKRKTSKETTYYYSRNHQYGSEDFEEIW